MKFSLILLLPLCFIISFGFSQNETRYWYTGFQAGLDFATSPPTPIYDGQTQSLETSSIQSDDCGNLLFYTDGYYVWNKEHSIMDNGSNIGGGCALEPALPIASATLGAIIIPVPYKCDLYYIFTTGCADTNLEDGLRYSLVDLSENDGLGKVIEKNILLYDLAIEKLNAVFHANGTDVWLLSRKYQSNEFNVFLIDSSGLQLEPIISTTGQISDGSGQGYMQLSPKGDRLVLITKNRNPEFFNFDKTNGLIEADFILPDSLNIGYFSAAFSPSGEKIYFSSANWFNAIWTVDQYDLVQESPEQIYASRTVLIEFELGQYKAFGGLQLGKDGAIYTTARSFMQGDDYVQTLDAIVAPEAAGLACNYTKNYVQILSNTDTAIPGFAWGLPNFIVSYLAPGYQSNRQQLIASFEFEQEDICGKEPIQFIDQSSGFCSIENWAWNFDDPASGAENTSSLPNPIHSFSAPGSYDVRLTIEAGCRSAVFVQRLEIGLGDLLAENELEDVQICEGDSVSLGYNLDNLNIYWSTGAQTDSITLQEEGLYWAELQADECSIRDTFEVQVLERPLLDLPAVFQWCEGEFLEINLPNSLSYSLNEVEQENPLQIIEEGNFTLIASDGDCSTEVAFLVRAENCPECAIYLPNAFSPNADGINDSFQAYSNCIPIAFRCQIFDRWGNKVFESNDIETVWNGQIRGEKAEIGVYSYLVQLRFLEKRIPVNRVLKGDITLLR